MCTFLFMKGGISKEVVGHVLVVASIPCAFFLWVTLDMGGLGALGAEITDMLPQILNQLGKLREL